MHGPEAGYLIQQRQDIRGRVTDEAGNPLPGVSITVKGAARGTTTDDQGRYTLENVTAGTTLVFSFLGYQSREVAVGGQTELNVTLSRETKSLDNVVITALGIKREEKALGYSVTQLNGSAVSDVRAPNMVSALSGKVAGVNIRSTSPDPGASVFINIRGKRTLYGEDQPLIVLDGVPMNNAVNGNASQPFGGGSGNNQIVDYGNPISDINPDDIASVSVLRGAAASALYGSRAGNGVILITTKNGSEAKKGIGVNVSSSVMFDKAWQFPEFQNVFGAGDRPGTDDVISDATWGPRLNDGSKRVQWDSPLDADGNPVPIPWVAYPDRVKNFYRTGSTITNSVAVTGANNNGNFRLSYGNMQNKGIVPNTDLSRNNLSLAAGYNLRPGIRVNANVAYTNNGSDNRPTYNRGSVNNIVYTLTPNVDTRKLRNYWVPGQEGLQQYAPVPGGNDNPYFVAYESINGFKRDRLTGNVQATVDITPEFSIMGRTGLDYYNEDRESRKAFSSDGYPNGAYAFEKLFFSEQNTDVLLSYKKNVSSDWFVSLSAGANQMIQHYNNIHMSTNELVSPKLYSIGNAKAGTVQNLSGAGKSKKRINSVYGMGQVAYKNMVFLDLTARNDWSSTLPAESRSYFYPSASLSAVISDIFKFRTETLSFAKLRANWSRVGNDVGPYELYNTVSLSEWGNVNVANISSSLANNHLKPELSTSVEFGADLRFLSDRLGVDFTWYRTNTVNQHLNIPVTTATGYASKSVNAGKISNEGVEISLNAVPVDRAFRWDLTANFTRNHNKVVRLTEGISQISLGGAEGVTFYVSEGNEIGDFYGTTWMTVPDGPYKGQPWLDDAGNYQDATEKVKIGNYNPDFMVGFTNNFSFKGFTLSALLDWRQGGQFFSYVAKNLLSDGRTTITVPGRDPQSGGLSWTDDQGRQRTDGSITDGYVQQADGSFVKNTAILDPESYYGSYYWDFPSRSTFSATYVKLREVSLTYTFSKKMLGRVPVTGISVGFIARNLFSWTVADVGYDPETSMVIQNGSFTPGVGGWTLPNTRSYGFKIGLTF
ncbi:SusC/RagA family TonB-linked outer membrane protein [Compostibacter hankyongensis]|uniref:SusC/RagA family TonB-linked outer membrane protein n=1 Tax=Compostibacter hankyongensis TaxID=1007089 RepID=A0ABP8FN32_9BACT